MRDPDLEVLDVLFLLGQPLLLLFLGSRLILTQFLQHIQFYLIEIGASHVELNYM